MPSLFRAPPVKQIVDSRGDQLADKVVVDITNPLDFSTFDSLVVAPDGSSAAELAAAVPSAKALKAFNTNFAATLASRKVGDLPTTVLIVGDDEDAKQALGFLQLTLAASEKINRDGGYGLVS